MNIIRKDTDSLNTVLTLQIVKEDYETKVETVLKDYRRKAKIDGFRPGMVPMGLVKKMYGKAVLLDEVNKIISENISKYIIDNKLHVLGDPLPNETEQKEIDWDNQTDYEFVFDLAIAPEVIIDLTKKDTFPYYDIQVEEAQIASYLQYYLKQYGKYVDTDVVIETELIKGNLTELDDAGNDLPNKIENTSLLLSSVKDEEMKKLFIGKKAGDQVVFHPAKSMDDNELAILLRTTKEKLVKPEHNFRMEIAGVSKFEPAVPGEELYDKIYGPGNVKTEEEFTQKIREEIKKNYEGESAYKFRFDTVEALIKKTNLLLPDETLKRWLLLTNKSKLTREEIDSQYPRFAEDLKWQLIKGQIQKTNQLQVTEEEILDLAKEVTLQQFRQYGITGLPEENLVTYAKKMLEKEEDRHRLEEKKQEDKVMDFIKQSVTLDVKEVTPAEFGKLFEAAGEQQHDHTEDSDHKH